MSRAIEWVKTYHHYYWPITGLMYGIANTINPKKHPWEYYSCGIVQVWWILNGITGWKNTLDMTIYTMTFGIAAALILNELTQRFFVIVVAMYMTGCENKIITKNETTTISDFGQVKVVRTYVDDIGLMSLDIEKKTLYIYRDIKRGEFPKTPPKIELSLEEIQITTDRGYHAVKDGNKILSILPNGPVTYPQIYAYLGDI